MKKKTLLILLMAAALMLSGCSSLVLRDSAVDAQQVILSINGENINKQTFSDLYSYNLYTEQQYAQLMAQFGASDGSVDSSKVLQDTAQTFITRILTNQKAAELGLDQFTDAENAEIDAEAQTQYEERLQTLKENLFAEADPTDEELTAAANNQGVTLESVRSSLVQSKISQRVQEYAAKDVVLDDAALQAALDEKIEAQKTRFESNANAYNTVVNAGDPLFITPAGYRVIRVIEATGDTAESDMQALADRVAAGEALDALGAEVKQYSVREGTTTPNADLVSAAMALTEKGSVTAVTQTATGYAMAEYTDDIPEATATLNEMRDTIYDEALQNAKTAAYNAAMNDWISAADVQMYLDRLN